MEEKREKRIVNYRLPVLCAGACIFGALLAQSAVKGSLNSVIWALSLLVVLLVPVLAKRGKIHVIFLLILAVLSGGSMLLQGFVWADKALAGKTLRVTARVTDETAVGEYSAEIVLDRLRVEKEGGGVRRLAGKARITLPVSGPEDILTDIKGGYELTFTAECAAVRPFPAFSVSKANQMSNGTHYYFSDVRGTEAAFGKPGMLQAVRMKVKSNLAEKMSGENAAVAYALLFGEKGGLDPGVYSAFRYSGLAHVLTVSGLHVTLLAYSVMRLLQRFRVRNITVLLVTAPVLIFYAALCGWASGVLRACIMTLVMLTARCARRRYDPLNSLCAAAALITLFLPYRMFTASFQLSFLATLGILSFSEVFRRFFTSHRVRMPRAIAAPLALALSAQIMTAPLSVEYFNTLTPYSLLSNILAVPLMTASYYALFFGSLISLVLPFMSFLLYVGAFFNYLFMGAAALFAALPGAAVTVINISAVILPVFYALTVLGRYVIAGARWRVAASVPFLLAAFILLLSANVPAAPVNAVACPDYGCYGGTVVYSERGTAYCGGMDYYGLNLLKKELFSRGRRGVEVFYLTAYAEEDAAPLRSALELFKPKLVLVAETAWNEASREGLDGALKGGKYRAAEDGGDYTAEGITLYTYLSEKGAAATVVEADGVTVLLVHTSSQAAFDIVEAKLPAEPDFAVWKKPLTSSITPAAEFVSYGYPQLLAAGEGGYTYLLP